ncbi:winged helix-turn-helix transcriptional regulator [Dyadobacter sandarakinus]|uniref:Winged helix-turn-helix transcriptional regulator n=2 Tax=Dyadobacter sandarakinus TaxID=2747268 RepID=A0ABX7ID76_9BACT|nr:winged helix-turn-helix transcriptional regulator [Dyadobacter sandarakinus]
MGALVMFNIHHISHLFAKKGNRELAKSGFSLLLEQLPVLFVVNASDALCSQQDIANHLQKDKAGIQRSIQTLVRDGYLRITVDSTDRRKNLIQLTPAGKMVVEKVIETAQGLDKLVTDRLEPQEVETLTRLLKKVALILEA